MPLLHTSLMLVCSLPSLAAPAGCGRQKAVESTAAEVQAVQDQHGDTGLEIGLAAHGKAGGGEQRIAHDQVRDQFPQRAILLALVVVGQTVEIVGVDEFVQRHRRAGGRTGGPTPFCDEDREHFREQLERLLREARA